MAEEFVSVHEFNLLKEEVQTIKQEMAENQKLLQVIDKKIDVIFEKISNADKTDELKLQPITARVAKLEENQSWLAKTVAGTIIAIIIKIIFEFANGGI